MRFRREAKFLEENALPCREWRSEVKFNGWRCVRYCRLSKPRGLGQQGLGDTQKTGEQDKETEALAPVEWQQNDGECSKWSGLLHFHFWGGTVWETKQHMVGDTDQLHVSQSKLSRSPGLFPVVVLAEDRGLIWTMKAVLELFSTRNRKTEYLPTAP